MRTTATAMQVDGMTRTPPVEGLDPPPVSSRVWPCQAARRERLLEDGIAEPSGHGRREAGPAVWGPGLFEHEHGGVDRRAGADHVEGAAPAVDRSVHVERGDAEGGPAGNSRAERVGDVSRAEGPSTIVTCPSKVSGVSSVGSFIARTRATPWNDPRPERVPARTSARRPPTWFALPFRAGLPSGTPPDSAQPASASVAA